MSQKPYYTDGRITIYHADCREILPTIPNDSVDVFWSDPPYGHSNHDGDLNDRLNNHRGIESNPIENDSQNEMREIVGFALTQAARFLKKDCCCCCCCCCCGGGGPKPTFAWLAQRMDTDGLEFFHSVIWDKINPGLGWRYRRQHEMVMVCHRAGGKLRWSNPDLAVPNVIRFSPPRNRQHPNEKPAGLINSFLLWHAKPDDLIIDPFLGSGTTLLAAKNLRLRAIGVEIDEKHCETAAKRLEQEVLQLETLGSRQEEQCDLNV